MTKWRPYLLVIVILIAAASLYLRGDWADSRSQDGGQDRTLSSDPPTTVTTFETRPESETAVDSIHVPAGSGLRNAVNCLSE